MGKDTSQGRGLWQSTFGMNTGDILRYDKKKTLNIRLGFWGHQIAAIFFSMSVFVQKLNKQIR